jgi:hypothetical protein
MIRDGAPAECKVWIDLDNSPHVPFFRPIIAELRRRRFEVLLTARDCFQVCGLARAAGLPYLKVGRHFGKHKLLKASGIALRALQLAPLVLRERPCVAVSHGSRAQRLAATLCGVPFVLLTDYEHARWLPWFRPAKVLVPEVIGAESLHVDPRVVVRYPGIKEDVYVPDFAPRPGILEELGLGREWVIVTVRPPSEEAHYRSPESERLFAAVMDHLGGRPEVRLVVLPRTPRQGARLRETWGRLCREGRLVIPAAVVDGLNLIWHSDLVVSGGGTMNREGAALGVPVYSVFRGKTGAVDRYLARTGRLVLLEGPRDLARIRVEKRPVNSHPLHRGHETLHFIVDEIIDCATLTIERLPRQHACLPWRAQTGN